MRSVMVVVMLPNLQLLPRILHRNELVDAQELVAQSTIERLDQPVVRGLSGSRVVELDAASLGPFIKRLGGELRAVVHRDRLGPAAFQCSLVQGLPDASPREPEVGL